MATLEQVERALRAADAAGNVEDARRLAQAYADMRRTSAPSFANVQSSATTTDSAPQESFADRELRGLGLGARSALQGVAGLVGVVADPFIATANRLGANQATMREGAGMLADRIGLPSPQNATERVRSDVGEALSGTAATMGVGGLLSAGRSALTSPGVATRAGDFLTAQPRLQAVSAATGSGASSITREQGGSEGRQLAAGLVGSLAPGAASAGTAATVRGVVRGRSGQQMQDNINAFARLGATPSVGQATQRPVLQGAENLLAGGPTSAGVMNRFAENQADAIGTGLQRTANQLSPNASGERAGRAIERGAELFAGNTKATKRALYWQADQFIPESTPVPMSRTWQAAVELTTPTPGAAATTGSLINPALTRLRDNLMQDLAAGGGQLPYSALKQVRSSIGEQISDYALAPDAPTRQLRRLYAALSQDMEAAAKAQGPAAERAARRANNYTRAAADRIEQVQRVVDKNGGPEKVYGAVMAGTRDGGTTLRAVMQSLPKDGQKAVTAAVIKRMGMATPGAQDATGEAFSAGTFLTNWNRISPEAKRALFDRYGPSFSRDVDRIARVADNIKQGSKVFANPSGTANRAAALTYGASLVASLFDPSLISTGGLVGSGVTANVVARWMTNPRVVQRLAQTTSMPKGALPPLISSLRTEGERDEDEELLQLAAHLEQRVNDTGQAP